MGLINIVQYEFKKVLSPSSFIIGIAVLIFQLLWDEVGTNVII